VQRGLKKSSHQSEMRLVAQSYCKSRLEPMGRFLQLADAISDYHKLARKIRLRVISGARAPFPLAGQAAESLGIKPLLGTLAAKMQIQ